MNTKRKLSQSEAGRVKSELESRYQKKVLYRHLVGYSPAEIARGLGSNITPDEIAKMAGREKEN